MSEWADGVNAELERRAERIHDLESALRWYVKHVQDCEGTDFLSGVWIHSESPEAALVKSFREVQY